MLITIQLADAFNDRRSLTGAFSLFADLVEKAAATGDGVEMCTPEGAELLAMFKREFTRNDERMAELLSTAGVQHG